MKNKYIMRHCTFPVTATLALLLAACGGEDELASPAADACEHMQDGPIAAVTAVAQSGPDAPGLDATHTRYDITLTGDAGALAGYVNLPIAEAAGYIVYFDTDIPMSLSDSQGATIAAIQQDVTECAEVSVGYVFDLGVGTYSLSLGPTDQQLVQLVMVPETDHDH